MFPYYLAIGMTTEEFWEKDPRLVVAFRRAHDLKREAENQKLWLQGFYIYDAFAVVLSNAFGKKGGKKHKYMEKPIDLFGKTDEEIRQEELRKQDAMIKSLTALQMNWQKKHPKEE